MDWLRTNLALAVEQGFVAPASSAEGADPLADLETLKLGEQSSLQRQLVSALLHLKQELNTAKASCNSDQKSSRG